LARPRIPRGAAQEAKGAIAKAARHALPKAKRVVPRAARVAKRAPRPRPRADSNRLKNIIDDIWKHAGKPGTAGDGTTFDALRNELRTGMPSNGIFHFEKAATYMNALRKIMNDVGRDAPYSAHDKQVASELFDMFVQAWKGQA